MADKTREQRSATALRNEAEKRFAHLEKISSGGDAEDIQKLVHELLVHQIELEMQNAQLAQTQAELEKSRAKYSDLFDFAPVGYLSLDENGVVLEANLTIATLLGAERMWMINSPFQVHVVVAFTLTSAGNACVHRLLSCASHNRQICSRSLKFGAQLVGGTFHAYYTRCQG